MRSSWSRRRRWAAAGMLFLAGVASPVGAQVPAAAPFRVNETAAASTAKPDVAIDGSGRFIVVWGDSGRLYDPDGSALGPSFVIGSGANVAVAMGTAGEFLVVWDGVQGRRYDASGNALGDAFALADAGTRPEVAADPRGGFVVTWVRDQSAFARRVDADGALRPEFRVNADTAAAVSRSAVAVDAIGNLLFTWQRSPTPSPAQVYARRFDASDAASGTEALVEDRAARPRAAFDPDGSSEVTFYNSLGQIRVAHFDSAGTARPTFTIGQLSPYTAYGPSIAPQRNGEFVVAWEHANYFPDTEDYGQYHVDVGRSASGGGFVLFRASDYSVRDNVGPEIAMSASGRGAVVWNTSGSVMARRIHVAWVEGTVTRSDTGEPVAGASLTIVGGATDAQGRYSGDTAPGTGTVTVVARGFKTLVVPDVVIPPGFSVHDFVLAPAAVLEPRYDFDDSGPGANGNSVFDPNERIRLRVPIRNTGLAAATGVRARVLPHPDLTILQDSATYPDVAPGAEADPSASFELVTSPSLVRGGLLVIPIELSSDDGVVTKSPRWRIGPRGRVSFEALGPIDIADNSYGALAIPVSGIEGTISNVELEMHLTHPSLRQVGLYLGGPITNSFTRQPVALSTANSLPASAADFGTGCPADGDDTAFSDAAPLALSEGSAPYVGAFRPASPLSSFDRRSDADVNGTWSLMAADVTAGLVGRIECARLSFEAYLPSTGGAQEIAVAGLVTDAATGQPVPGATVRTSTGFSTSTGPDGRYRLDVLPATMDVAASAKGHAARVVAGVTAAAGATQTVDLALLADTIFADGFESGDLSAWNGGNDDGGDLRASAAARLAGAYGLEAVVDDRQALYVRDLRPVDEPRYRARLWLDPSGFDPGEAAGAHRAVVFIGMEEAPARRLLQVMLKRTAGQYAVGSRLTLDDGSLADTPFVAISAAPHAIEIDWVKASAPGRNDGTFRMWVDGIAQPPLTHLDTDEHSLDFIRLGAMAIKEGASGVLRLDRFKSRRETYIGP